MYWQKKNDCFLITHRSYQHELQFFGIMIWQFDTQAMNQFFLINKYIFIRYFIVTFGAEVACKWRDPAMLRCPYFSDENLPSREFGSSSRCVATRKIMAGPPYSWWSTFWMTKLMGHPSSRIMGKSHFWVKTKGNPTYESERHRENPSFW